jgi:tetratricopeptide (TPR) repeat protein
MTITPTPGKSRLYLLLGILAVGGVALPVSRLVLNRKPAPPSSSASVSVQRRYWQSRIKTDISDTESYVRLGELEERAGYYMSAQRYLLAARSLGATDRQVCAPLGRALSHLAQEEAAFIELKKAMALAPDSIEVVLNLAGAYIEARRTPDAVALLNTWVASHPNLQDPKALERLILAFLSCSEDKVAYKLSQSLLILTPDASGALSLAARCAFSVGELAGARAALEKLLPNAPDPAGVNYLYGMVLNRQKDYDGALKAWQEANARNPGALDVYEKIGQEYARRGDFKKAAYALDQIATADQQYPAVLRAALAYQKIGATYDAAYWNAVAAGLRGEFQKALAEAQRAATSPDPHQKRRGQTAVAEAYRGMKRTVDYIRTIEELTQEKTVDDLLLRAYAYHEVESQEFLQKRLLCLREAVQKSPERRGAITLEIAEQLRHTGQRDEAEKEMEDALQALPSEDSQRLGLMQKLSEFYLDRRDQGDRLAKAIPLAEQVANLTPQDEQAWLVLGQCYAAQNQLTRAAIALEHVIDLEPGYGPGYLELARVYAKQGNTQGNQQMMKLYSKFVGFEQKHQTLQTRSRGPKAKTEDILAFGEFLITAGDLEGATGEFERVFRRDSKNPQAREALKQLYSRLGYTDRLLSLEAAK